MKREKIQDFTKRITQSNSSQLVVILYEMLLAYLEDAKQAQVVNNQEAYHSAIEKALPIVSELMEGLNFKYAVSRELMQLYLYMNRMLIHAKMKKEYDNLEGVWYIAEKMLYAFRQISDKDTSEPLMKNTQQVYAGLTYGKGNLNEMPDLSRKRGFLA